MSETHWKKLRREAMERKRGGGFYSKTAGKGFSDMDRAPAFGGTKDCSADLGKWMAKSQKDWTVEGGGRFTENFVRRLTHIEE